MRRKQGVRVVVVGLFFYRNPPGYGGERGTTAIEVLRESGSFFQTV